MSDPIRFDGQSVVVTGAGNGLGRCYALELARRGAMVVVNDLGGDPHGVGSSRIADEVVDLIRSEGGQAVANYETVATRAGAESIIRTAIDRFGRVDGLINNAGILRDRLFENLSEEDLDMVIDTHLKGSFYVAQAAYKEMMRQGGGRILFTSSASGMFGFPAQSNYAAAKAGIFGMMNVIAIEGAQHGILANALLPRGTSRLDHATSDETPLTKQIPEGTELIAGAFGPEFVTPLAVYLVSRECRTTHGVYSAMSNRFARAFVGLAPGWKGGASPASVEDIAAHWSEIGDPAGYAEPLSVFDEFRIEIARARKSL